MPQISSNFILRSKLSNFERDSFDTLESMNKVASSWMDEGHISYCKEDGHHYIFISTDANHQSLEGEDRWTRLIPDSDTSEGVKSVDTLDNLTDNLAQSLPIGAIVYVIESDQFYYNIYNPNKDIQTSDYQEGKFGWFRQLFPNQGDIPSLENYVTKNELEGYVKREDIPNIPSLEDYAKKTEVDALTSQISTISAATGAIQNNLNNYKNEVESTYASKENLNDYVSYKEFQNNSSATIARIQTNETDIASIKSQIDIVDGSYVPKSDFDAYKEKVELTYAKPEDISGLLNTYAPSVEHENRWVGSTLAGDLAGKTGKEIANESYSYNAVFDQILFSQYTPTISNPSINVELKSNWKDDMSIDWFDEEKRIILIEAGNTGPDGGDFKAVNIKDAYITYPKGIDLATNFTNGLIPATDEKQTSIGFCKIKNQSGEWEYYKKDNNIYHVPATLEEGEYRYYMAAYFKKGSPALNNDGMTVAEWNERIPIESEDYITIIASKPTYSNTQEGFVKNPIRGFGDMIVDYMTLAPSCQIEQAFMTPRKLKELYIWNDVSGYAKVPMVYQKDGGQLTDNLIPAYFTESIEDNGYYTYRYDSATNGHRGEIKIKVIF